MPLYIVEPSLRDQGGHHFEFAATIAAEAASMGKEVSIFAHKDCTIKTAGVAKIIPWFSHHIYENIQSSIAYNLSNFLYFNKSLYRDLKRLQQTFNFGREDMLLFPTLSENQLWAVVRWSEQFKARQGPVLVSYLMFSPDFWTTPDAHLSQEGPHNERALFYKFALQNAIAGGTPLKVFAGGRQLAREFSALTQFRIDAHPLPFSLGTATQRSGTPRQLTVLLHAGTAKEDKGLLFLADLAERLSIENCGDQFLIHLDFRSTPNTPPQHSRAYAELLAICKGNTNITLRTGVLSRQDYLAFIGQADCFVCTYDPVTYARKTSGVVWEAISTGLPILGPDKTFIQREAREWGAGFLSYSTWSATGIAEAYSLFRKNVGELAIASQAAREQFCAANNSSALADHLKSCATPLPQPHRPGPLTSLRSRPSFLILAWLRFSVRQRLFAKLGMGLLAGRSG
jgi:glycosyltransferase involved in cell wall biosynthesis